MKLKNRFKNRYNWQIHENGSPNKMPYTARDFRAGIWARMARVNSELFIKDFFSSLGEILNDYKK